MAKALSPKEIGAVQGNDIPEFIFEAVNNTLRKTLRGGVAKFTQDQLMVEALRLAPDGTTRKQIFDNCWFDFEDMYREKGWRVAYNKPGYCESYKAYFTFSSR